MKGKSSISSLLMLTWISFTVMACFFGQHATVEAASSSPNPNMTCERLNASCDECLKNVSCMWCNNPQKCMVYPIKNVLPSTKDCALSQARWGVCWLNFEAMIISVSVIGGVLLIGITLCCCKCCGCCCFSNNSSKYKKEVERMEREKQERSVRQDERKKDRQQRNDDIRRKYGLLGSSSDSGSKYQKFENEATNAWSLFAFENQKREKTNFGEAWCETITISTNAWKVEYLPAASPYTKISHLSCLSLLLSTI